MSRLGLNRPHPARAHRCDSARVHGGVSSAVYKGRSLPFGDSSGGGIDPDFDGSGGIHKVSTAGLTSQSRKPRGAANGCASMNGLP